MGTVYCLTKVMSSFYIVYIIMYLQEGVPRSPAGAPDGMGNTQRCLPATITIVIARRAQPDVAIP